MIPIKQLLNEKLSKALDQASKQKASNANVISSSRPEFGDYQANGVMAIAKKLRTNPRELAQRAVDILSGEDQDLVDRYEVAGPGFINIFLSNTSICQRASMLLADSSALIPQAEVSQRIVIDYSSPNLAKEMHVGHLRGTIIGDALVRILQSQGHDIIRQNHVGDWGTQFGMLITHMRDCRSQQEHSTSTELADLEVFYREAKARFDEDSDFAERARLAVVELQGGNPEHLAVWKQFIDESLKHCEAVYRRLNITLTRSDLKPESFYNDQLAKIITLLEEKEMLTLSKGAKCIFMEEFRSKDDTLKPIIVQKSDGGYLYATTDLAAVQYRAQELEADRVLYVVDARQSLHFQQVFAAARKAGLTTDKTSFEHIAYGTMMGQDGRPFKTRSGDTIKLADLLQEAQNRALELVTEKNPDMPIDERGQIAAKVGIAAVKYADLSKNRTSDYVFEWSTMLSFEGNTAPYLMYAYARIKSILAKQSTDIDGSGIVADLEQEERRLLIKLLQLPEIIDAVAIDCYPNSLCNYLYELAGVFMRFYEACPILKADKEIRNSRLAIAALTATTLDTGLQLLGIDTLEQM